MTRAEIEALAAGEELDDLIRIHVMNDEVVEEYSSHMVPAWRVVEELAKSSDHVELHLEDPYPYSRHVCIITPVCENQDWKITGTGDTMPIAICRAALLRENDRWPKVLA